MNNWTYKELIKHMEQVLETAQVKRRDRPFMTELPSLYGSLPDRVPEWNVYEMGEMLTAVNLVRLNEFKSPVPLSAVRVVERQAYGHSDYSHKFALYCADLAWK